MDLRKENAMIMCLVGGASPGIWVGNKSVSAPQLPCKCMLSNTHSAKVPHICTPS